MVEDSEILQGSGRGHAIEKRSIWEQSGVDSLVQFLKEWQNAWQNRDIDPFMSFYSRDFCSKDKKMDYRQFRRHEAGIFREYTYIRITIGEIAIQRHAEKVVIRFSQKYESDRYSDRGEKTLVLIKHGDKYQIIEEDFRKD